MTVYMYSALVLGKITHWGQDFDVYIKQFFTLMILCMFLPSKEWKSSPFGCLYSPYKRNATQIWLFHKKGLRSTLNKYPFKRTKIWGSPFLGSDEQEIQRIYTMCGHGGHLCHVIRTSWRNFRFPAKTASKWKQDKIGPVLSEEKLFENAEDDEGLRRDYPTQAQTFGSGELQIQ